MKYQLEVLPAAASTIKRLDKTISFRVILKLKWLSDNFDNINHIKLQGEYSQFFKLRMGDYRIFYTFSREENIIFIHRIAHRSDAYKQL